MRRRGQLMATPRERAAAAVKAETEQLADLSIGYPANHFAWRFVLSAARARGASQVIEVGVGHGNGLAHVLAAGLGFAGIDHDPACVQATRSVAQGVGIDPDRIVLADIEDEASLRALPGHGAFDTLVALGVLPSVQDEARALRNMAALVRPGGELFVECRNSLFALVTFNRFTQSLIVDDLLSDASAQTKEHVSAFLAPRLDLHRPPLPTSGAEARYHNPLAMPAWFESQGFVDVSVHPFHYHAGMPPMEAVDPAAFRAESLAMEAAASGWKGLFLCSAFLVRAIRPM